MKNTILDSFIKNLNTNKLTTYLIESGWQNDAQVRNVATVWHHPNNLDAELIYPNRDVARDFAQRVGDLLFTLASFEDLSVEELIQRIDNYFADLVKVRVIHSDVSEGTIPFEDGILLYEKTRELMASAVQSTISKKTHFTGGHPADVDDYIRSLRLGQTEIGSYVINILAPVEKAIGSQVDFDNTSFSRMVTNNLLSSLNALSSAIDEYHETQMYSTFDNVIAKGVSSNMCEALIGISGKNKQRSIEISITPSLTQELQQINLPLSINFDFESINVLEKLVEYWVEQPVYLNKQITGQVMRLTREPNSKNGSIRVSCMIGNIEKNVDFELSDIEYIEAIHAHEQKLEVSCIGDLYMYKRSAKLLNPKNFQIFGDGKLFS